MTNAAMTIKMWFSICTSALSNEIEYVQSPSSQEISFLTEQINLETQELGTAYRFAFFIRDTDNQIIAGCNGSAIFGVIYTDQLWVHPDHLKLGIGRKLMDYIQEYGRSLGCKLATVTTLSFQNTRKFYEKLDYKVEFEHPRYTQVSSCLFLRRSL